MFFDLNPSSLTTKNDTSASFASQQRWGEDDSAFQLGISYQFLSHAYTGCEYSDKEPQVAPDPWIYTPSRPSWSGLVFVILYSDSVYLHVILPMHEYGLLVHRFVFPIVIYTL